MCVTSFNCFQTIFSLRESAEWLSERRRGRSIGFSLRSETMNIIRNCSEWKSIRESSCWSNGNSHSINLLTLTWSHARNETRRCFVCGFFFRYFLFFIRLDLSIFSVLTRKIEINFSMSGVETTALLVYRSNIPSNNNHFPFSRYYGSIAFHLLQIIRNSHEAFSEKML